MLALTPSSTVSSPYTMNGWRPISVTIQPKKLASHGSGTIHTRARRYHRVSSSPSRRRHQRNSPRKAVSSRSIPMPTISRNDQYTGSTGGM